MLFRWSYCTENTRNVNWFRKPPYCEKSPVGNVGKFAEEFEWRIPHFFSLPKEVDKYEISHTFSFAGESWYIAIFPNGVTEENTVGRVGLLLRRCSSGLPINLEYTFCLKTLKGEKFQEKHFTYNFTEAKQAYGTSDYITRKELFKKRSELLPNGGLTVVCLIKNPKSMENIGKSCI